MKKKQRNCDKWNKEHSLSLRRNLFVPFPLFFSTYFFFFLFLPFLRLPPSFLFFPFSYFLPSPFPFLSLFLFIPSFRCNFFSFLFSFFSLVSYLSFSPFLLSFFPFFPILLSFPSFFHSHPLFLPVFLSYILPSISFPSSFFSLLFILSSSYSPSSFLPVHSFSHFLTDLQ